LHENKSFRKKENIPFYFCYMSDKDFQNLMELAQELQKKEVSKEEALRSLIECGLLDKDGNLICPELDPYLRGIKPLSELRR
jgi:hypothetical protein